MIISCFITNVQLYIFIDINNTAYYNYKCERGDQYYYSLTFYFVTSTSLIMPQPGV